MAENSYSQVQQQWIGVIDSIQTKVEALDSKIVEMIGHFTKGFNEGAGSPNALNSKIKELEENFKKLNDAFEQQKQNTAELNTARKEAIQAIAKENVERRALNKEARTEAQATSKLVGEYQNLIARRNQARVALQNLIASEKASNTEIKKAQKEFDRLQAKVNQANRAVSNFSNTSLGGAVRGFKNLLGAFGVVGGVYMFADLIKNVFQTTKQLQSLDYALKTVTKSEEDYARVQAFLNDITERYGVELVTTTERYTKFLTAAQQSNVSMSDTEKIFESVTKAAGVLGLKTHELEGVYLALEQMLSKGKVTTEELRRQLGERLPGAFGIMADAIGVNVRQLDEMLKKGEVLSAEALPKFADALEKAYGIEQVDRIDTLQAAHTRMSNAWINFVKSLDGSEGTITKVFTTLLNFATKVLDVITELNKGQQGMLQGVYDTVYEDAKKYYESLEDFDNKRIEALKKLSEKEGISANEKKKYLLEIEAIEKRNAENAENVAKDRMKQASLSIKMLEDEIAIGKEAIRIYQAREGGNVTKDQIADYDKYKDKVGELESALSREKAAYDAANDYLNRNNQQITENTTVTEENVNAKREKIKALDLESKGYDSIKYQAEQMLNVYKEVRKLYNDGSEQAIRLDKIITSLNDSINNESAFLKQANEEILNSIDAYNKAEEEAEKFGETLKELLDFQKEFRKGFVTDFMGDMGFDFLGQVFDQFEEFKALIDEGKATWEDYFLGISEIAQETFNFLNKNQEAYFDNQLDRLAEEKKESIRFAGDSAEAKEEIERQYEEKRKEILRRKAEAEKKTAIFNAIIDTAQAVVAALAVGPPQGFIFAALAGAIGAAQIAMIASQPIPEYFRGTMNADEGWALVDEKNPEVHTDSQGRIKSLGKEKANHRWLSRGDKIYTSHEEYFNKELKHLLSTNDIEYGSMIDLMPNIVVENKTDNREIVRHLKSLESTVRNNEGNEITIDRNGFYIGTKKFNTRTERMNNILHLKGKGV